MHTAFMLVLCLVAAPERPKDQSAALKALCEHLGIGTGDVIGDIGAGNGRDTWVFAEVVGAEGTVFAEEIEEKKVERIKKNAEKRELTQVRAVLGTGDDPKLPEKSADMLYMHRVYHHFAQPRPMLRAMWRSLKPGGHMVVVDQRRGTLRDWVERSVRAKKHYFIAETTVVREAREEGFRYVECAEHCWHDKSPFVLVFQRPPGLEEPAGDPDPFLPLDAETVAAYLRPLNGPYARTAFVAVGEGRGLLPALARATEGESREIVLEEWATQKDERPPLPDGLSLPATLTEQGDPRLSAEPLSAVFFLDTYDLLFHGETLLAKLHERLAPEGMLFVLDRAAPEPLERREGSHRRMIHPQTVVEECVAAGFHLWARGPQPAGDRFLLLFGRAPVRRLDATSDPCVAGPVVAGDPGMWLYRNLWRLRGMRAADGRVVDLDAPDGEALAPRAVRPLASTRRPGALMFEIPSLSRTLLFRRGEGVYRLVAPMESASPASGH